ncbi:hypothetical protein Apa02nite_089000 [Actinoplanes palleronii]|uniref:CopC domain-containing protein n=1 Tax=Actinoplanes palleronii TaxID=113570 RepID=A0ABQ4BQ97_9ACTN|nr:hypothetical protein Apa02nite_089000 [Actinoplanes palleronii]
MLRESAAPGRAGGVVLREAAVPRRAGAVVTRLLAALAVLVAVLVPGSPAWAHAQLVAADPAKEATLTAAPASVTLRFSERLNPDYTTIVVSDAARQPVPAAAPTIDGASATITIGQTLGNGAYLVAYRVVSADGHTVQGSYPFTLADPAHPAAALSAAAPVAAAPPDSSGGGTGPLISLIAAGLLLAAAIFWYARKRRPPPR